MRFPLAGFVSFAVLVPAALVMTLPARAQKPAPPARKPVSGKLAPVPVLLREAIQAADAIPDANGKVSALCLIGEARGRAGNLPGAKQSFALARQSADSMPETEARTEALRRIASAQAKAGDRASAKLTFAAASQDAQQGDKPEDKARMLANLAADQGQANFAESRETFALAKQVADAITDPIPHTFSLCWIAKAQMRAGDKAEAAQTARDAELLSGQIPDRYWKDRVRGLEVVGTLAATGSLDAGRSMTEQIGDAYMKSSALWGIAAMEMQTGAAARARETARRIPNDYLKSTALSDVASRQARAGDLTGARETAKYITDDFRSQAATAAIAVAQADAGDTEGARQTAKTVADDGLKGETLIAIACAEVRAGSLTAARATLLPISGNPYWKAAAPARLALALLAAK